MKFDPKKLNALSVRLHGKQIGVINRLAGDRQIFAFEQDYIDDPQRPTLSLSFKGSTGGLVTALRPVPRRVPPFFSNLLPEGHLREYLAKLADVNPEREFFLLAVLGADLPGALVVAPLEGDAQEDDAHHDDADADDDDDRPRESRAAVFSRRRAVEVFRRHGSLRRPDRSRRTAWAGRGSSSFLPPASPPSPRTNS